MAEDFLEDDSADIAALEKEQRQDKGTIGGEPKEPKAEPKQATPEPVAKSAPDTDDVLPEDVREDNNGKFIRHGAFHAERERRKAAEREREADRANFAQTAAQMQQRLMALIEAQQRPQQQVQQPQAPALPDKDVDPVGYLEGLANKNAQELRQISEWRQQQEQGQQRNTTLTAVQAEVARLESQFKATTPDYDAAQKHLENAWISEAKAAGYQDHQLPQIIAARTMEIIQAAAAMNGNPASIAYQVAKARGYTGQQQPANNLDTVARGLAVSTSPTTARGSSPSATPALDALLQMPDDEFSAAVEGKNWEKIRRQMMGGNASGASY